MFHCSPFLLIFFLLGLPDIPRFCARRPCCNRINSKKKFYYRETNLLNGKNVAGCFTSFKIYFIISTQIKYDSYLRK